MGVFFSDIIKNASKTAIGGDGSETESKALAFGIGACRNFHDSGFDFRGNFC